MIDRDQDALLAKLKSRPYDQQTFEVLGDTPSMAKVFKT